MIASSVRLARTRDGEEVRAALCRATGSEVPRGWDNAAVNALLEMADLPKDARDPLALKQRLAALQLPDLQLKQRKAVIAALEAQLKSARALELPERLHVDTPPPEDPDVVASRRVLVPAARAPSPPRIPVAGAGDGFEWTQSDAELTISVPVPAGTGKNEVLLQMTPRFGPARQLVLRARFWPRPLVAGELHAEVEASESMWHLDEKGDHVVIDLPKISEALWPAPFAPLPALAAPPPAATATGGEPAADDDGPRIVEVEPTGGGESDDLGSLGVARIVQLMGQSPRALPLQLRGCAALMRQLGADDGAAVAAGNARAVPVLLRALRTHGQHAELQSDAWRLLLAMGRAQPYLRRLIVDGGAMGLLLSALSAHQTDERAHLTHLLAIRALLSSFSPKAFVEASGVELLCEAVLQRPTSLAHAEAAAGSLHMLSGVNNVVRRKVINARVLPPLLALLGGAAAGRPSTHETVLGVLVQLLKVDDEYSRESLVEQAAVAAVAASLAALPAAAAVQAEGCRALAALLLSPPQARALVDSGGAAAAVAAAAAHADVAAVVQEATNLLEAAIVLLCDSLNESPPTEELEIDGMGNALLIVDRRGRRGRRLVGDLAGRRHHGAVVGNGLAQRLAALDLRHQFGVHGVHEDRRATLEL